MISYDKQEYFVPELLMCADALYIGLDILKPHIKIEDLGDKPKGQVVMARFRETCMISGKTLSS